MACGAFSSRDQALENPLRTRTNDEWLSDLNTPGQRQEEALGDLRGVILGGLPYALSKWLSPSDPQFDPLAEEVTQDTLLKVLDNLGTFEGRSKFTTWVHKIAVRVALTELRRRRWRDVSLDEVLSGDDVAAPLNLLADVQTDPDLAAERTDMVERIERIIMEELTEKQRNALVAVTIRGIPIQEVARMMDTNQNALYKLLHDARLRLKRRLTEVRLSPEEVLASFEEG